MRQDNGMKLVLILWPSCGLSTEQLIEEALKANISLLKSDSLQICEGFYKRFYALKVRYAKGKERHCGTGEARVYVLEDNHPEFVDDISNYFEIVNKRVLTFKQNLRSLDGGGHRVHASLNAGEFLHNSLFLPARIIKSPKADIRFDRLSDFFEVLNRLELSYVVLRNYDRIENCLETAHPDIDMMVSDRDYLVNSLGLKRAYSPKFRAAYSIEINGRKVNLDLRSENDGYLPCDLSRDILATRTQFRNFYVPSITLSRIALIYHIIIHKNDVSEDYKNILKNTTRKDLDAILRKFNYCYSVPKDYSVLYNGPFILSRDYFIHRLMRFILTFRSVLWRFLK